MIGIVVAAHDALAPALVATARLVVRSETEITDVAVRATDDSASYEARLRTAIEATQADGGVLVLTDMFGGTPSNVGMTLHDPGRVEVLTGVNLPMLIKAIQLSREETSLVTAAREVRAAGQRSIAVASEILATPGPAQDVTDSTPTGSDR